MDEDLRTIDALNAFAQTKGLQLEIQGGYATDALLGEKIQRPHGDIDAILWFANMKPEGIEDEVISLLENEKTEWTVHSKKPGFLELRESNKSIPDFPSRRRIELYILLNSRGRDLIPKTLEDSKGNQHSFLVLEINQFVAHKIAKLLERDRQTAEEREKLGFRDTQESDKQDLIKLISSPTFNREKATTTEEDWQEAMKIMDYSQQGS